MDEKTFRCKSIDYNFKDGICNLSSKNMNDIPLATDSNHKFVHIHLKQLMIDNLKIVQEKQQQEPECNYTLKLRPNIPSLMYSKDDAFK